MAGLLSLALTGAACGSGSEPTSESGKVESEQERVDLRLGYYPNVTHAAAVAGVEKGIFAERLGEGVNLTTPTFDSGGTVVQALFAGALDASYIGPNPAINAFSESRGKAVRIVAGATSGGAFLVVKPGIDSPSDLKAKLLATPSRGNTQDVALRAWLAEQGLETTLEGGGDVSILPQENGQTLETFRSGLIDGAWVPEPWATRLISEGGGKVLVDERDLWPGGEFVTTQLMVSTKFLNKHPDVVEKLVRAHVAATDFVNSEPVEAQALVNQAIARITGQPVKDTVIQGAWKNLTFTVDPIADSLRGSAESAKAVGLLDPATSLDGIYDLTILNKVLAGRGQPEVKG